MPTRCIFTNDPKDDVPIRVAAGGNHTLVLFKSGAVYAAGSNKHGQCGHPLELTTFLSFRRVVISDGGELCHDRFKMVSATWEASFLVSIEGHVYAFGLGQKGELGLGEMCMEALVPKRLSGFPPSRLEVVEIASCVGHTVAVLSNGEVSGWGAARKGQLGHSGRTDKIIWTPWKIETELFEARYVACGRDFTVIVGHGAKSDFVVLGSDKWNVSSSAPLKLKAKPTIASSWGSVYLLDQDGSIQSWGRDDHGQLPPKDMPKLMRMAVGSEHVVALTEDGKVIVWGWGEHGNCGTPTSENGDVKGRWNVIELELGHESRVTGVGAGCATSWIILGPK